ncbi:MAG: alpha/beta hydrolase [Flavobacterium sp.]|nr:MAG: alpha/beta hydrolase [Flavobacterium sp.]
MNRLLITMFFFFSLAVSAQSTASKNVSTFTIDAPQLGTTKKIWLYLPENYKSSKKPLPVIYMHDAQNLFDKSTSYVGEWQVDETLDSLKAQVIVVGIEHGGDKRIDELTPYKNAKYGGGKADQYLDFIVNTLKPYIDKNYRTNRDVKHTAIFGSSLGGLVSFYAVLKYPKVFGKAGVFSPSFWYTDDIYKLMENAPKTKAKIYFLAGDSESKDDDVVGDVKKMERLLDANRCACLKLTKSVVVKGGQHNEKMWRQWFGKAYLWLF